ncbi:MAG: hypothetical protein ACP5FH_06225, partial [Terracidiphilus sp.]
DEKGRKRVTYKRYQTPLETLLGLENPAQFLRPGLSLQALQRIAAQFSDTEAARRMQQAKARLFDQLRAAPERGASIPPRPARVSDGTLADSREGKVGALDRQPIRHAR